MVRINKRTGWQRWVTLAALVGFAGMATYGIWFQQVTVYAADRKTVVDQFQGSELVRQAVAQTVVCDRETGRVFDPKAVQNTAIPAPDNTQNEGDADCPT